MNLFPIESNSIIRIFRYIEWTLLCGYFLIYFLTYFLTHNLPGIYAAQPFNTFVVITCLGLCFLSSFVLPVARPTWQKIVYIFGELMLVTFVNTMGLSWDVLVYLVLAKSCFILKHKYIIMTTILIGIVWNLGTFIGIVKKIEFQRLHMPELMARLSDTNSIIIVNFINHSISYLATSIFVILFSFVLIAEQKSRQRAEVLAKEVETLAANLERTRIARDIHDSLGHTLTTLDVQLELAQKLRQRDSIKAFQALDTAKILASQCLQDVRLSIQTIRQSNFNLNEALNTLVEQVKQNQRFTIQVELNLPQLPLQTSHQLYCIVQEAFTNIQKYAQADCVKLHGWSNNESITIKIIDNGKGFDLKLLHSGFGLRGMHERVQLLGGKLQIETNLGVGTKIQVMIPRVES